jgi:hypothetical protein
MPSSVLGVILSQYLVRYFTKPDFGWPEDLGLVALQHQPLLLIKGLCYGRKCRLSTILVLDENNNVVSVS